MISDQDINIMRRCAANRQRYRTDVEVDLTEAINLDLESFMDMVSMRATGSVLMQELDWVIVDYKGNTVILEVSGDVTEVIRELNEFQVQY